MPPSVADVFIEALTKGVDQNSNLDITHVTFGPQFEYNTKVKDKMKRVYGPACKFNKIIDRGWYKTKFLEDCFEEFLNERRKKGDGAVFVADHYMSVSNLLAGEDTQTLRFYVEAGKKQYLQYEAFLPAEDDMTDMQKTVTQLVKQKLLTQVSVGIAIKEYSWDLEDEDNPIMNIMKATIRELSVVVKGAFGKDATIKMSLAGKDNPDSQEMCAMRFLELQEDGETYGDMDMKKSYQKALEEKKAAESSEDDDESEFDPAQVKIENLGKLVGSDGKEIEVPEAEDMTAQALEGIHNKPELKLEGSNNDAPDKETMESNEEGDTESLSESHPDSNEPGDAPGTELPKEPLVDSKSVEQRLKELELASNTRTIRNSRQIAATTRTGLK